jgi:hypothetical protein
MALQPYRDTNHLLRDVPLPDMVLLRQRFPRPRVEDIPATVHSVLDASYLRQKITPGARIAVAVGSRGVASIALLVRSLVAQLRQYGADPFIVPAMGSHGGATPEGQYEVLQSLGVKEEYIGAPIISSLEVDQLGELANGLPVYIDRAAHQADGIILINRVKPHTDFGAPIESGLAKMTAIGLGKHKGALAIHSWGVEGLAVHIPSVAQYAATHAAILGGLAVIENGYDEVAELVFVPSDGIGTEVERTLLERAKSMMPRLPWDTLDVLVVDELGKNISGSGMDPNIVGRMRLGEQKSTAASITNIAILDVTEASHGNAIGAGLADFTTARLMEKADIQSWYINCLTAGVIAMNSGKLPMVFETDREAVAAALRSSGRPDITKVTIARIKNTLSLEYILASRNSLDSLRADSDVEQIGALHPFAVATDQSLVPFMEIVQQVMAV